VALNTEILDEYKAVLTSLRVHPTVIGTSVNLLREEGEVVKSTAAAGDVDDEPRLPETLESSRTTGQPTLSDRTATQRDTVRGIRAPPLTARPESRIVQPFCSATAIWHVVRSYVKCRQYSAEGGPSLPKAIEELRQASFEEDALT